MKIYNRGKPQLTTIQIQNIIITYQQNNTIKQTAILNNVSETTVFKYITETKLNRKHTLQFQERLLDSKQLNREEFIYKFKVSKNLYYWYKNFKVKRNKI